MWDPDMKKSLELLGQRQAPTTCTCSFFRDRGLSLTQAARWPRHVPGTQPGFC